MNCKITYKDLVEAWGEQEFNIFVNGAHLNSLFALNENNVVNKDIENITGSKVSIGLIEFIEMVLNDPTIKNPLTMQAFTMSEINHYLRDLFSKLVLEGTLTYTKRLYNYKAVDHSYTSKTQMITQTNDLISDYLNSLDFSKICYIEKNGWRKYLPFDSTDEERKFAFVHPYTGVEERFDTKNELDDRINSLKNIFENEYTQNLNKNIKEEVSIELNEEITIKAWIPYNA